MGPKPVPFEDKFMPEPMSGCWLWTKAVSGDGYGTHTVDQKQYAAHRFAWETYRGAIPKDRQVLHKCDVPICVNPDHLYLGTRLDNARDALERGQYCGHQGMEHRSAKLIDNQVREIIQSTERGVDLARKFNVSASVICMIRKRRLWRHIDV